MRITGFVLADEDVSAPGPIVETGANVPGYSGGAEHLSERLFGMGSAYPASGKLTSLSSTVPTPSVSGADGAWDGVTGWTGRYRNRGQGMDAGLEGVGGPERRRRLRGEGMVEVVERRSAALRLHGHLLSAGRWTYRCDGENRLVKRVSAAWTQPPHPPDPKGSSRPGTLCPAVTLEFVYDGVSRRVQKKPSMMFVPRSVGGLFSLSHLWFLYYLLWLCALVLGLRFLVTRSEPVASRLRGWADGWVARLMRSPGFILWPTPKPPASSPDG